VTPKMQFYAHDPICVVTWCKEKRIIGFGLCEGHFRDYSSLGAGPVYSFVKRVEYKDFTCGGCGDKFFGDDYVCDDCRSKQYG
jgi:hypothetical protein